MNCPVCGEERDLFPAEFTLIPGWYAYKCTECINDGMEPRFTVVLAALLRVNSPYMAAIVNYSYYGPPIEAAEIVPI